MKKVNPLVSDDTINAILQIATAFQKSKILLTACELDIFSALSNEELTAKEVAVECDVDERAVERLMNALVAMNLLNKNNEGQFSNTKGTRRFLVKNRAEYIGNLAFLTNLWESWSTLTEVVKTGKLVKAQNINDKADDWIESFAESTHWRAQLQAPDIIDLIHLDGVNHVLDLGCGSGLYAISFKRAYPNLKVSVLDYPKVTNFTRKNIEREGFDGQINIIPADFNTDPIGKGYDIVFISDVLSYQSVWENIALMHKIHDALNNKGRIIIQETLINEERTEPLEAALVSLNMMLNTNSGDAFTDPDIWMILKEGWFTNIKTVHTQFGTTLISGEK